jgi:hypothetical protein
MNNIEIGRYGADEAKDLRTGKGFSGWISGEDNDGRGWILWLDEYGRPSCFFGRRDLDGIVHGPMVRLAPGAEEVCPA